MTYSMDADGVVDVDHEYGRRPAGRATNQTTRGGRRRGNTSPRAHHVPLTPITVLSANPEGLAVAYEML